MPSRDWTLRIHNIRDCIDRVQRYTADMTFEAFCADDKTIDAVVCNFEIIGEAARHIPPEIET